MDFIDFQIRAWQQDEHSIQVIVHSSPVGSIRQPVTTVPFNSHQIKDSLHLIVNGQQLGKPETYQVVIEVGKLLWELLFPPEIYKLLIQSLEKIGDEHGLRLRLCLDEFLIDLPWEFLYRPDTPSHKPLSGFLTLNPHISLVREAPIVFKRSKPSRRQQRLLFVGALSPSDVDNNGDPFEVKREYEEISKSKALEDVKEFLSTKFVSASDDYIEEELRHLTAVFHYSGHTDVTQKGQGYLVKELNLCLYPNPRDNPQRLFSEWLGTLLNKAGTKLAVFTACNSGQWAFMEPLIRAGIPALIGIQGIVSTNSCIAFSRKLYSSLAIGISLDEAVILARLYLLYEIQSGRISAGTVPLRQENCEWGSFMVYMPAVDTCLLPKPRQGDVIERQQAARRQYILAEPELKALMTEKDSQIRRLENMVTTALERPSFYAQTYNNQGDTMSGDRNINMGTGNYNERIEGDYIQGNSYGNRKQSNFNLQGAQFAGGLVDAETVNAHQIGGNITNYTSKQKQNPELLKTILILAANPKTTIPLRLDEEVREIDAGLQRAKKRELFNLKQRWAVRVQDVYQSLLDFKPQFVHFSGHGSGDDGLMLEDEAGSVRLVETAALAGLFEVFANMIECVMLNACYSEVQAGAIAQHIPYVIGMKKDISDQAAIKFATGFYSALGAGESVEFAYKLGCSVVQLDGIDEHLTPVLMKK